MYVQKRRDDDELDRVDADPSITGRLPSFDQIIPRLRRNPETRRIDGEHAIAIGQTRFGKTYLAKRMSAYFDDVIIHDPKNKFFVPDGRSIRKVDELYKVDRERDPEAPRVLIYQPPFNKRDDPIANEEFCSYCFRRGRCLVIFDELVRIGTINRYPPSMKYLYTAGAEEGICVLGLTQEPVQIPTFTYTQAAHLYGFFIAHESHRKKLSGLMPISDEQIRGLYKKEFYYWRNDMRDAIGPIEL